MTLIHQVTRAAGWLWRFLHPGRVARERDDALRRLAEIRDLLPGALQAWAENYNREKVRMALVEIGRLSELPIDKQADP